MTGDLAEQAMGHPPTHYVRVYIASKLLHAERIKALRAAWPLIYFTARWPAAASISSEQNRPAQHWIEDNLSDIARSEFVIIDAEPEDELKGAIFEVGYATAFDKPVYVIGYNRSYSKWQFARNMRRRPTLEHALRELSEMAKYAQEAGND